MAQRAAHTGRKPVGRRRLAEWLDALLLLAVVQSLCVPYQTLDRHFARSRLVSLLDVVMNDMFPMQHPTDMDTPPPPGNYQAFKLRQPGLRWRDDEALARMAAGNLYTPNGRPLTIRPLLTEARNSRQFDWGQNASTSNEPSLEDIDLIDVLWRQDIDVEKGNTPLIPTPAEQYERDLQLLTEKSFTAPLSTGENWLYENLSKAYYEDFYLHSHKQASKLNSFADVNGNLASSSAVACKRETATPTDEELDALLRDVEKGDLNLPEEQPLREQHNATQQLLMSPRLFDEPILNNVSLADAMRQNSTNATDFVLHEFFTDMPTGAIDFGALMEATIPTPTIALNETDANYWFSNPQVRSDVRDSFANRDDLLEQQTRVRRSPDQLVPSSGDEADVLMETMSPFFELDPVKKMPLSAVGASGFDQPCSSNSAASSPDRRAEHDYAWGTVVSAIASARARAGSFSDEDEDDTGSRMVGKLLPAKMEMDEDDDDAIQLENSSPDSSSDAGASGARRRGRQSKDEQLARSCNLPVSAASIAAMTLTEFQRLLRSDELNDAQRALIRKIRRRGKNKVAARTCRQRRGANMVMLETETSLLTQERNVEAARHSQLTEEVNREVALIDQLERDLDE